MSPHFGLKFSFRSNFVWRLSTDFDCNKRGQTFRPVARVAISTSCNIEASSCSRNLLLGRQYCSRCVVFMELPYLPVVRLCVDLALYNDLNFLLRQDLCYPSSSPNSGARPILARAAKSRRNDIEHGTIQKDCVWGSVGTVCVALLLSSVSCCDVVGEFHRFNAVYCPGMEVYDLRCFPELVFKPVPILLEDHGSETSGERHNQTMLLFLWLVS